MCRQYRKCPVAVCVHEGCGVKKTSRGGAFASGFVMFAINGIGQPLKKTKMLIHKNSPARCLYFFSSYMSISTRNAILYAK
jgi:hypothetical protein